MTNSKFNSKMFIITTLILGTCALISANSFKMDMALLSDYEYDGPGENDNDNQQDFKAKIRGILTAFIDSANLGFGDTCDSKLEAHGLTALKKLEAAQTKVQKARAEAQAGVKDNVENNSGRVVYSDSAEDMAKDGFLELEKYVKLIQNSRIQSICNGSQVLFCDPDTDQCACGRNIKRKGFAYKFDETRGTCAYDSASGSGCNPFQKSGIACFGKSAVCKTVLTNQKCTVENILSEADKHGSRFHRILRTKGYVCACDNGDIN